MARRYAAKGLVSSLPLWAQRDIESLQRTIKEFEKREAERVNGDSARTFSVIHLGFNPYRRNVPLQSDEVSFRLGEDPTNDQQTIDAHILIDPTDDVYELRLQGYSAIRVLPQASNSVLIRLDR